MINIDDKELIQLAAKAAGVPVMSFMTPSVIKVESKRQAGIHLMMTAMLCDQQTT